MVRLTWLYYGHFIAKLGVYLLLIYWIYYDHFKAKLRGTFIAI